MTEKEIVQAIKDSLQATMNHETGEPGILHTSGLSYTADSKGNLKELYFIDKNGNKTPIDINNPSNKTYKVCYDSFVAKGTEYPAFIPETHENSQIEQTFDFDKDKLLIDYLNKMPNKDNLTVKDDGRIKIIEEDGSIRSVSSKKQTSEPVQSQAAITPDGKNPTVKTALLTSYSPLLLSRIENLKSTAAINGYSA